MIDGLRGALILPGDQAYDQARRVWNGMIDKRPLAIARAAGVADVMAVVHFARKHNLLLAVRGGGHNVAGSATCDGGIVLDLGAMNSVHVDPVRRVSKAEPPGATSTIKPRRLGSQRPAGWFRQRVWVA